MNQYIKLLLSFIKILPRKYSYKFVYVLFILVISSIFETLTIYLIGSMTNLIVPKNRSIPSKIISLDFLNFPNLEDPFFYVLFVLGICFISLILRFYSARCISFYSAELTSFTNKNIILNVFNSPYSDFSIRKTSTVLSTITTLANQLQDYILQPFFLACKGFLLTLATYILFLFTSVKLTFILTLPPLISYFFILKFNKKPISKSGNELKNNSESSVQVASDLVTGFKDIILDNSIVNFTNQFYKFDYLSRKANAQIYLLSTNPRLAAEFTAYTSLGLAILISLYSKNNNNINLSALAICAVGLQKILPSMQQIFFYLTRLQSMNKYLLTLNNAIKESYSFIKTFSKYTSKNNSINLNNFKNIEINNVTYRHKELDEKSINKPIVENLNLTIPKGRNILITGPSGSGKSTLLDIMMGFYKPQEGGVIINSKNESINLLPDEIKFSVGTIIGHCPQNVHIYEGDIIFNITLQENYKYYNSDFYNKIIEIVLLKDLINSLPEGNKTTIGQGGLQLSGGQKQRIGIARCLFKNKPILFLDECSSALDNKSTRIIMNSLISNFRDNTIIMVSHDLTLKNYFDETYILNDGILQRNYNI